MKAILTRIVSFQVSARERGAAMLFVATIFVGISWPFAAHAQVTYLGDMLCSMANNLYPPGGGIFSLGSLINGIAYIAGAIFVGTGLVLLTRYTQNPSGETKLHNPIMHIIGGGALLAVPAMMSWLVQSLALVPGGGGITSCSGVAPTTVGTGVTLDVLIENLVMNIKDPMTMFLSVICYTMGTFMIVRGLVKASKYGYDPRTHSVPSILSNLIVGAVLFVVGQSLNVVLGTLFQTNTVQASAVMYSWTIFTAMNATPQFEAAVYACLTFIQIIGMIAFIRGWLILKNSAEGKGQATMAQGITHILGGVLAINIYSFLEVMDSTFGTGLL